ncbi:MAG: arginase family protein [Quadrisphaera sp.]
MSSTAPSSGGHLRLVWPQWQGAGSTSVTALLPDLPLAEARRSYTVGTAVLQAVLPPHDGPTAVVPVRIDDHGLDERDGIEAKTAVLDQLDDALALIDQHDPERITTLGGDCGVSLGPFSALAARYDGDVAVIWVDSHPDMDTGQTSYAGYHAMVVSALTGHGDAELLDRLPAVLPASKVALVGMHDWTDPAHEPVAAEWGLSVFSPEQLRTDSTALLEWLRGTGARRVLVHFDVDTVDADEFQLGLGYDAGGLTSAQARRVVADVAAAAEVVALTVAEYVPRQVMHLQRILRGFPLLG